MIIDHSFRQGVKLVKECKGDSILSIEFEDAASGQLVSIPVRVLSIDLGNGTTEYLATNLFDKAYTAEDFKELFFMRWNLELKYNELKNQLLLEEFNGATSVSVEQEFYINLLPIKSSTFPLKNKGFSTIYLY